MTLRQRLADLPARFWIASAVLAALLVFFAVRVLPRLTIETNLLALLPSTAENRLQLSAVRRFADRASRELTFVVGTGDPERLRATGEAFANTLARSGAFARVDFLIDDRYVTAARAERADRMALLSPRHREQLARGDVAALEREALRAAYSPLAFARPFRVADDPLGLASDAFAAQLPAAGRARLQGDILVVEGGGKEWTLVRAATAGDPYRTQTQQDVTEAIRAARAAAISATPDAEIAGLGVVLHSAAGASRAQGEIATFGTIDLIAVVLLIVLVFRMVRPLLFTLVTLGVSTVMAIAACHYVFGQVHILTLTFGTSLIGVSVDYSLHYFVNRMRATGDDAPPHNIVPALILGCTTTVAGYLTLFVAPIPGLRQIALFSAVGLVTACAMVILLYPGFRAEMARSVPGWVAKLAALRVDTLLPRSTWLVVLVLLLTMTAFGWSRLTTRDDIRALLRPPAELVAAEKQVRELTGLSIDTRFVLVTGATPEQVLLNLETLQPRLDALVAAKQVDGYMSVTPGVASRTRQRADRALLNDHVYTADGALARVMLRLGFSADAVAARIAEFDTSSGRELSVEQWLSSPLSQPVRQLWLGELNGGHAAVVLLDRIHDPDAVRASAENIPGVSFVDQAASLTGVLAEYRQVASWVMVVVITVMLACLLVFYRSGAAVRTALPAVAGIAMTLAALGALGEPLNLLHVLSLLLVLGLGVDYAIILREGRSQQALLAVFLSMTTTLISFGLLGFSSVPFVRSIGITVAFGVALTFLIAVAAKPRPH